MAGASVTTPAARTTPPPPRLVVIGASAGAIDALSVVLPAFPKGSPVSVVVVVHVPPNRPHRLEQLFAPRCALEVLEATDKLELAPGVLTFAPSDYHLLIDQGPSLALSLEPPLYYSRPAIDLTFFSAAEALGARALGVVLSGASADGSRGLAHVIAHGGRGWVQTPTEAYAETMPKAAIAACPEAEVLSLAAMAERLATFRPMLQETTP